jgi:hypothetical protein
MLDRLGWRVGLAVLLIEAAAFVTICILAHERMLGVLYMARSGGR